MKSLVEKFGSTGAILAALACPICFPKLAIVGTAVGLGALAPYEGYTAIAVQALFVVAFVGQAVAYRTHRRKTLLTLSSLATVILFCGYYVFPSSVLLELALVGLVVSSAWQYAEMKRCARCAPEGADFADNSSTLGSPRR